MRKLLSRILPLAMAAVMLLAAIPASALWSDAYGDQLTAIPTQLHYGTTLTTETYWSDYYKDRRVERYITYTPNESVKPLAYSASAVTAKTTVLEGANVLAQEGYRVVAGINADFFDGNGTPTGILISGGELLSSDGGNNAVGFRADGSAVIGTPALALRGTLNGAGSAYIAGLNKARNSYGGIYAYTYDFNASHTTGTTEAGVDVILEEMWTSEFAGNPTELLGDVAAVPTIGKTAYYQVVEVVERTSGATSVQPGQLVLSCNAKASQEELSYLRGMVAGDVFGLKITASDSAWNDVVEAVGGLYLLVKNGVAQTNFEATNAPRTAVGIKANGDVVFYTVDGRKTGYSIGSSLGVLAQRLVELGCVSAICLDGGGSTTTVATTPDTTDPDVLNVPSDGSSRKVSSILYLVADGTPTRDADHVYLAADSQHVMAGSSMEIYANLVDTNYIPMSGRVTLDASDGTIRDNIFTAPESGGLVTITGTSGSRQGTLTVNVVETPDEIQITRDSAKITELTVEPGGSVDLSAVAYYKRMQLATQDSDFTWSVTGNIGTIDENGVFTAGRTPGSGTITLTKGKTSATVSVTLTNLPLETMEDFEDTNLSYSGYGVTATRDTATVRYGSASLKVSYQFPDATGAALQLGLDAVEGFDLLTFSVYGDGSGNVLSLYDNQGSITPLVTLDFTGWKQVSVTLPDGCTSLSALTITGNTPAGTIYLDQFVASYNGIVDNTPPVIQNGTLTGTTLTATVTDATDGALGQGSISLTCDGAAVTFQVSSGTLTADLSGVLADGKAHLVALTAWDASGNRVRQVWDVAATAATTSPFADNVNADGTPHWAATYLDRLYEMGVLTGEEENGQRYVRPNRNMTRMEFAVMVFRYMGLSAADYENVQLPFADNSKIQSWALTAVKAMYSLGIMTGNQETDGLYFDPSGTITRSQAITMLGRLQEKGYASNDLSAFSDGKDVPSWALPYVQTMVAQGILTGNDGKLSPNAAMTRAEACKLLYMMQ